MVVFHVMEGFKCHEDIVSNDFPSLESTLIFRYDKGKDRFEPISKDF